MGKTNWLVKEKSPYLLQHAENPVNWYPWGREAFKRAEQENKLIFLSIGYSTCHWCHVMEQESFSDTEVADLLNESFISIKVDREERPDIDAFYMDASMLLTGSGGWPLNIVMTADKKPFFAATYIPKNNFGGRKGLLQLLPEIETVWKTRRKEVFSSADSIARELKKQSIPISRTPEKETEEIPEKAFRELAGRFDRDGGGFGRAPKFPAAHNIIFLLRYWKRSREPFALEMAEKTLRAMRHGGIYDHIGFGFHRYSTDRTWRVPHFEKMLYDQAMLVLAYTEAYQATGNGEFRKTAKEIITYVLRDLRDENGGFYSAEDADSEGGEGKFYLWSSEEFKKVLNGKYQAYADYFHIKDAGNFTDSVSGRKDGSNILYTAAESKHPEFEREFMKVRETLFSEREKRKRPFLDDKILTDWNGLMISALSRAGWVYAVPEFIRAAEKAAAFVLKRMKTESGGLMHRFRGGEVGIPGTLDDYAYLISGLLELYRADFHPEHLQAAVELEKYLTNHFYDREHGGYFSISDKADDLPGRLKKGIDNAVPSGNAVMIDNLARLYRITVNPAYAEQAEKALSCFRGLLEEFPANTAMMISGYQLFRGGGSEIIIAGSDLGGTAEKMIEAVRSVYLPESVVILKNEDNSELLDRIAPYTAQYKTEAGYVKGFVCRDFSCSFPADAPETLQKLLIDS